MIKLVGFSISGIPAKTPSKAQTCCQKVLTRTAFRAKIPQNSNSLLTLFDGAGFYGGHEIGFCIENSCFPCKAQPFFTSNFGNGTSGGEISLQYPVISIESDL
jgi:hypothetical protein